MATIQPCCDFDDEKQAAMAKSLSEAMECWGTSEESLVKVLVSVNNEQRQDLAAKYKQSYGKDLRDQIKDEVSGDLLEVLLALLMEPVEYDCYQLNQAVSGAGTDERPLIDILSTRTNEDIQKIKAYYKEKYEVELEEDVVCDTAGDLKYLLVSLVTGARDDDDFCVDEDRCSADADKLIEAGVGQCGTNESEINSVLCCRSRENLRRVFDMYQERREGTPIEDDIESEMSGSVKDGFLAIVKSSRNLYEYLAERLHASMSGAGTSDNDLIRIIVTRAEKDLQCIMDCFNATHEQSLYDWIDGEASGDYRSALLSILSGSYVE